MILLDDYRGKDTGWHRCEALSLMHVTATRLKKEATLYKEKWFDYRRLHHAEATMLFADFYCIAARSAHAKHFDIETAARSAGFRGAHLFAIKKSEIGAFWAARQVADSYGMPYGFFCLRAINIVMRQCSWKYIPRPGQLYGEETIKELGSDWEALKRQRLFLAENAYFLLENDVGAPDQVAYRKWLVENIANRTHPEYALSDVLNKHIREEDALQMLDEKVVKLAMLLCQ